MSLFHRHSLALQGSFSEVKRAAHEQPFILAGTSGSVGVREVSGGRFYYRQFYDAEGNKCADYIGPVGNPLAELKVKVVREAVAVAQQITEEARLLGQWGYVRAEKRAVAVLGSLANHRVFAAGAVLVGSHAYGALLNELGVSAAFLPTEDVDVARDRRLDAGTFDGAEFRQMLDESTVKLVAVPGFVGEPSTSYKVPGREKFRVDLLVPSAQDVVSVKSVPELGASAQAMPFLRPLLVEPIDSVVLGREAIVPVKVPRPEAMAWHKVMVSQLRAATLDKRNKDMAQAAVLLAVLVQDSLASLRDAFSQLPPKAKALVRRGVAPVVRLLEDAGQDRAVEEVSAIVGRG